MNEEFEAMSRKELIAQGSCCGSECLNCPYIPKYVKDSTLLDTKT